jgi:hypothetical protein
MHQFSRLTRTSWDEPDAIDLERDEKDYWAEHEERTGETEEEARARRIEDRQELIREREFNKQPNT